MIHTQVHPGRGYELRSLDGHSDLWLWVLSLVAPQVIEFTSDGGLEAQEKKMPGNCFLLSLPCPSSPPPVCLSHPQPREGSTNCEGAIFWDETETHFLDPIK